VPLCWEGNNCLFLWVPIALGSRGIFSLYLSQSLERKLLEGSSLALPSLFALLLPQHLAEASAQKESKHVLNQVRLSVPSHLGYSGSKWGTISI
jgi:hypothetical protein